MRHRTRLLAWVLALIAGSATALAQGAPRQATESIGTWILTCPPKIEEPCLMRHRDWVLAPSSGGPSAALEIQARDDTLVPVVTLRGLPAPAAMGGAFVVKPTVTMGFDGGKRSAMTCGSSGAYYACAPDAAIVPVLSAALPGAKTISASINLSIPGIFTLPPQDRSLELSGTVAALARLRGVGAIGEALPAIPGLDIQAFLDRLMRDLGFPNGAADILPQIMPFIGKLGS